MIRFRQARPDDAEGMSLVLQALIATGQRQSPGDVDFVRDRYLNDPARLACTLAQDDDGRILGFQSLKRAGPGNPYGTPVGWGIIGTHIAPWAHRRGVGRGLFAVTRDAIAAAGLPHVEATIGLQNAQGRAYYAAMGFATWRETPEVDARAFPPVP